MIILEGEPIVSHMKSILLPVICLTAGVALIFGSQNPQAPRNTATVRGKIVFNGTQTARVINMSSDPGCPGGPQSNHEGLEDVIVYATPQVQAAYFPPANGVLLDRLGCRFVPHTMTMQVGQGLVIRNSDTTAHNAHGWPVTNKPFNISLASRGAETTQFLQQEEIFPIRDDVHNWESANVGVFLHPYHTVSKVNGVYEFVVPEGSYEIVAWHEKLGTVSQSVDLRAGETRALDITLK